MPKLVSAWNLLFLRRRARGWPSKLAEPLPSPALTPLPLPAHTVEVLPRALRRRNKRFEVLGRGLGYAVARGSFFQALG